MRNKPDFRGFEKGSLGPAKVCNCAGVDYGRLTETLTSRAETVVNAHGR